MSVISRIKTHKIRHFFCSACTDPEQGRAGLLGTPYSFLPCPCANPTQHELHCFLNSQLQDTTTSFTLLVVDHHSNYHHCSSAEPCLCYSQCVLNHIPNATNHSVVVRGMANSCVCKGEDYHFTMGESIPNLCSI